MLGYQAFHNRDLKKVEESQKPDKSKETSDSSDNGKDEAAGDTCPWKRRWGSGSSLRGVQKVLISSAVTPELQMVTIATASGSQPAYVWSSSDTTTQQPRPLTPSTESSCHHSSCSSLTGSETQTESQTDDTISQGSRTSSGSSTACPGYSSDSLNSQVSFSEYPQVYSYAGYTDHDCTDNTYSTPIHRQMAGKLRRVVVRVKSRVNRGVAGIRRKLVTILGECDIVYNFDV